jgi:hypothetical protein
MVYVPAELNVTVAGFVAAVIPFQLFTGIPDAPMPPAVTVHPVAGEMV